MAANPKDNFLKFMAEHEAWEKRLQQAFINPAKGSKSNIKIEEIITDPNEKIKREKEAAAKAEEDKKAQAAAKAEQDKNDQIWNSELWPAVKAKDQKKIDELKKRAITVDLLNSDKGTALLQTIRDFDIESFMFLLENGANPNLVCTTRYGRFTTSPLEMILDRVESNEVENDANKKEIFGRMVNALMIYNLSPKFSWSANVRKEVDELNEAEDFRCQSLVAATKDLDEEMAIIRRTLENCIKPESFKQSLKNKLGEEVLRTADIDLDKINEYSHVNINRICNIMYQVLNDTFGIPTLNSVKEDLASKLQFYNQFPKQIQLYSEEVLKQYNNLLSKYHEELNPYLLRVIHKIIFNYFESELKQIVLDDRHKEKKFLNFSYEKNDKEDPLKKIKKANLNRNFHKENPEFLMPRVSRE